ncbi:MAG TPA: phosphoribosylglycinamide formyltransferase [Pirellulaceae bacterium]
MTRNHPLPIAVLISGAGRSLKNLLDRAAAGKLPVQVRVVISSHPRVAGLAIAESANIATATICREDFVDTKSYSAALFAICREREVDLVVLAGFLKHILIPEDFRQRVINIHPSLIPAFCGKGFYGEKVHRAVLESGARVTGCTVHYVDDQYDHGPIILRRTVAVLDDDTPESLSARVFAEECEALPEAILKAGRHAADPASRRIGEPPGA